jgi:type II secretory pathway pseudopilin PulG
MISRKLFSNKGLTIVELLVATAIIGFALVSFIGGFIALKNISHRTSVTSTFDKQINEICGNIKAGIETYQVNFNYKDSTSSDQLPVDKLPMAWDVDVVSTKKDCPWCQGTYGYTIQPLEAMRGLYAVQVRFTHKSWGENTRDFSFVVSVK